MKIYIDKDFRCHTKPADGRREHECSFFDGKCEKFINGYRYVPDGETWIRSDGIEFTGEMISPIENPVILNIYDDVDKAKECIVANSEYVVQMELDKAMAGIK